MPVSDKYISSLHPYVAGYCNNEDYPMVPHAFYPYANSGYPQDYYVGRQKKDKNLLIGGGILAAGLVALFLLLKKPAKIKNIKIVPMPTPRKKTIAKSIAEKIKVDFYGKKVKISHTTPAGETILSEFPIRKGKIIFDGADPAVTNKWLEIINRINANKGVARQFKTSNKFTIKDKGAILEIIKNSSCGESVTSDTSFMSKCSELMQKIFGDGGKFINP